MYILPRHLRSSGRTFGGIGATSLVLALVLAAIAWVFTHVFTTRDAFQGQRDGQPQGTLVVDYSVTAEVGYIRANGTANLPNGITLVGTLDKVGSGLIEVKEALVMNRLFVLEFGPDLSVHYYLHSPQNALQPGVYRMSVEFDPSRQSPFAQESLSRSPIMKASPLSGNGSREIDSARIRLSKTFAIGTIEEQQETQAREQQSREAVRQHLRDTLGRLISFWSRLHVRYQQERVKGSFSRADPRASEWQTWTAQWLPDLEGYGKETRLHEVVSPASPYSTAQNALMNMHKQLAVMPDFYFEVLINERSLTDRDLQRAEQGIQYALGDGIAELGQPDNVPSPVKVESAKPTVIVTAPLVNVRNGPGMSHESIKQLKRDDVLDFLAEQGEWFQVQLGGGRTGWVHRNVASKHLQGERSADDTKRGDVKPANVESRPQLRLEPIRPLSTPVEFIPRPTSDEVRIYVELEQQLRDLHAGNAAERRAVEQLSLQRMSDKHGISPEQVWNTYLKVQGWEIRP
jgi:Bacterial SH3 domain